MTASAYSFTTINTTSLPDSMTNAQVYSTFKSCVLRLHDALNMRRNKKTKPQLVISAPFDFKKEDSMSILPGTFGEELFMLREKAAASIVGSALNSPYEAYSDSVTLTPSSVYDLHFSGSCLNCCTSSCDKHSLHRHDSSSLLGPQPISCSGHLSRSSSNTAPILGISKSGLSSSACSSPTVHHMTMAPPTPTLSVRSGSVPCCRRCRSTAVKEQHQHRIGGGPTFYPPIVLASTEPYAPTGLSFPSSSSSASSISSREHFF